MLQFSQTEVEGELHDFFKHGYIRDVSVISGIGETYLKRGLNPNDEHRSYAYDFLRVQCGLDERDPVQGELHWMKVCQFREMSKPMALVHLDLKSSASANLKESSDVAQKAIDDRPLEEQLSEVLEQEAAVQRHKNAILEAINLRNQVAASSGNGRRPFRTAAR